MALTPNVVANAPILSSWGNEIRNRSVQVFASAAERTSQWPSPPEGAPSYLVDTPGVTWVYSSSTWRPSAARGVPVAPALTTAGMTPTDSTVVDVPGLSVTFNALAGRYYRYTVCGHFVGTVATTDSIRLRVTNSGGTAIASWDHWVLFTNVGTLFTVVATELIAAAGSTTRKVRVARQTGTGTVQVFSDATRPATLIVEEIGAP